ncbi:MAG: ABC transporter permease [Clostridia bacterium]|nr:ABC transporter permease [Clostridia bacterium]
MSTAAALIKRNIKLFFKDKGMFFSVLITPIILLILYTTFLRNIYMESFTSVIPEQLSVPDSLLNGLVDTQLVSSLLAVSCITIAFCSNMLMVQDKASGVIKDLRISPVKSSTLSISYYAATFLSSVMICLIALVLCLIYMAIEGWFLPLADIGLMVLDVILLVMFGCALSSVINFFLTTQGQISAVGTIVSSGYGFICGAYMPIAFFGKGLQTVLMFFPGTYGTALIRNHAMRSAIAELVKQGLPSAAAEGIKDSIDCNIYFQDARVGIPTMYIVLGATIAVLLFIYIIMNMIKKGNK